MVNFATKHNDPEKRMGWSERLGYGAGACGFNMVNAIIGSFMTVYFTNVALLDAAIIATLIAVSKLFDGVSDLIVGNIVDRTESSFGKARVWLLRMVIPFAVWVSPQFTFFGFRYVRVTGWIGTLDPADFVGKVLYSDMESTGSIVTGHGKLNRLFLNSMWGQKSNSVDIATDCPQRDERLGWTGDAQVFSGTGCYNMDAAGFYNKFCHDLSVEQNKLGGLMPGVIPVLEH